MQRIMAISVVLGVAGWVGADCPTPTRYYYPAVKHHVPYVEHCASPIILQPATYQVGYNAIGDLAQQQQRMAIAQEQHNALVMQMLNAMNPQAATTGIEQAGRQALSAVCAACHTGESARKGYQIFTAQGVFNEAKFADLKERDFLGNTVLLRTKMPPKDHPQPSAEQYKAIAEWVAGKQLAAANQPQPQPQIQPMQSPQQQVPLTTRPGY